MIRRPTIRPSQSGDQDASSRLTLQEMTITRSTAVIRPTSAQALYRIQVSATGNNKLLGYASLRGAVWNATPFDTTTNALASAYDPTSETAITDDGICYAVNMDDNNSACLLVNRAGPGGGGILSFDLPSTCVFLAYRQIPIPVASADPIVAWEGYWA